MALESAERRKLTKSFLYVAQFGAVGAFPAKFGGKSIALDTKYYASTGALENVMLTSEPLVTKGAVDSVNSSVNALLDARNAQREAARSEADELNRLQRRRDILEAQARILAACRNLGIPDSECRE